ncbi:MAG: M23 family metallopeptidase [Acidobacteria bacterium]|nr:M23 family metallopeptidase [Acidobacteriota bacterium]
MRNLIRCSMLMAFCSALILPAMAQKAAVKLTVEHQPEVLSPGSPFVITVTTAKPLASLEACWADGRRIVFSADKKGKIWRGVGVVIPRSPDEHPLVLAGRLKSRKMFSQPHILQIVEGRFPTELILSLPVPLTEIVSSGADPDDQSDIPLPEDNPGKRLQAAFTRLTLEPLWSGNFAEPLDLVTITGKTAPNFGEKIALRNFKPHKGEDMKADRSNVKAMNSGIVALAEEMKCEGRMIVLDHGQGWLSVYLHLSELKVEVNQRVTKQQIIALSGRSGTCCHGAHLHVGVRWQTVYVNPADVLKLEWPMAKSPPPNPAPVKKPTPSTPTEKPKPPAPTKKPEPPVSNIAFDFVAAAQQSVWRNQAKEPAQFHCAKAETTNCVEMRDGVKLEDDSTQARVIEMRPVFGGSLSGAYAIANPLRRGDRFLVKVGFTQRVKKERIGKAVWRVLFQSRPGNPAKEIGRLDKNYNGSLSAWEIDLSPYAGQTGTLIIETINLTNNQNYLGLVWVKPRIER